MHRMRSWYNEDPYFPTSALGLREFQEEMNRIFDGAFSDSGSNYPPINVLVTEEGATALAELPGVDPQSIDVSAYGNTVTIKGERKGVKTGEGERFIRRERGVGSFARALELGFTINADKVEAEYRAGILRLSIPRADEDRPRKITVR